MTLSGEAGDWDLVIARPLLASVPVIPTYVRFSFRGLDILALLPFWGAARQAFGKRESQYQGL